MSFKKSLAASLILFFTLPAHALYSHMTTGDLAIPNRFEAGAETQFVASGDTGLNVLGRLDGGIDDESNYRAELGLGTTDFQAAAYYKYVPVPDIEGQPAVGLMTGLLFAHQEEVNELSARFHPFLSKKFFTEIGNFNSYVALPLGLRSVDGDLDVPIQLTIGTEHETPNVENVIFLGELAFNLKNAFSYVSFGVKFILDENHSFQLN